MHWIPMTWRGNNMSSDIPVLSMRNLSVSYKEKPVVKNVSFDLRSGESIALVGESGCGKSTILRAVMRILPDQGHVSGGDIMYGYTSILTMNNAEWRGLSGRHIAMIFQQPGGYFDPIRKIGLQFKDFMMAHGVEKKEWYAMAMKCLMDSGFPDAERILDSYAFQLSGGMQQRVAVAMTLAFYPEVLLMDEPTSALDTVSVIAFLNRMKKLIDKGSSILFVTHNIRAAAYLSDQLLIMKHGEIIEAGRREQLMNMPSEPYTEELLRAAVDLR